MIRIKDLTVKNFMSVGNISQAVNFNEETLTLVLGENLDQGGEQNRNGTGKCVQSDTVVKVRNTLTGKIYETSVGDLYAAVSKS